MGRGLGAHPCLEGPSGKDWDRWIVPWYECRGQKTVVRVGSLPPSLVLGTEVKLSGLVASSFSG